MTNYKTGFKNFIMLSIVLIFFGMLSISKAFATTNTLYTAPNGVVYATSTTDNVSDVSVIGYRTPTDIQYNPSNITLLNSLGGIPVTRIGNGAFENDQKLIVIQLPDTLITIGAEAFFDCRNLGNIIIPETVKTIGARAFSETPMMTSVALPKEITSIDDTAFYNTINNNSRILAGYSTNKVFMNFINTHGYKFKQLNDTNLYTVLFNKQGGIGENIILSSSVAMNSLLSAPVVPIKTGYIFDGWYLSGSTTAWNFATDRIKGVTTLFAKWTVAKVGAATSVKAISTSYNSINISWNASSYTDGYQLFRSTSINGSYVCVATTTSRSFTNVGLSTNSAYYYKVRSYKHVGNTTLYGASWSNIASAKPAPAAVTNVTATRVSSTSIKIVWSKVTGASGYEVFRSNAVGGPFVLLTSTSSLYSYYTNSSLVTGKTYYYKVRAYRLVGAVKVYSSTWSNISYARP